eukprot:UN06395
MDGSGWIYNPEEWNTYIDRGLQRNLGSFKRWIKSKLLFQTPKEGIMIEEFIKKLMTIDMRKY